MSRAAAKPRNAFSKPAPASMLPASISSKAAQAAMEAHTNLNLLGVIKVLCRSSLVYGQRMQRLEDRITAICSKEQGIQLRLMDKATGRRSES